MGHTRRILTAAILVVFGYLHPSAQAFKTEWECSMDVSDEMKKAGELCFEKYPIKVHDKEEYFKDRDGMKFTDDEMNNFICIMCELKVIDGPATLNFEFDVMLKHVDKFKSSEKEKEGLKSIVTECKTEIDEVVPENGRVRIEGILRCFVFKFHQKSKEICEEATSSTS